MKTTLTNQSTPHTKPRLNKQSQPTYKTNITLAQHTAKPITYTNLTQPTNRKQKTHVTIRTKKQIGKHVPRRTKNKLEKAYKDVPRQSWKKRTKNKLEKVYQGVAICCCPVWA